MNLLFGTKSMDGSNPKICLGDPYEDESHMGHSYDGTMDNQWF